MQIVIATDQHKASIAECVEAMHAESQYKHIQYDKFKIQRLINTMIHDQGSVIIVAVDDEEVVQGFIALEEYQYFFNFDNYVADLAFYVRPAKRGTTVTYRLLHEAEIWAKEHGKALVLGITAPTDATKLANMYSKCGFVPWGTVMRKEF